MATNVLTKEQRQHLLSRIAQHTTNLRSTPRKRVQPTAVARAAAILQAWEADQNDAWNKRQKAVSEAQKKATAAVEFPTSREAALAAVVAFESKDI